MFQSLIICQLNEVEVAFLSDVSFLLYNPVCNLPSVPVGTFDGLTTAEGLHRTGVPQVFHKGGAGRGWLPNEAFFERIALSVDIVIGVLTNIVESSFKNSAL
jgi:hypothetical protein